MTAILVIGLGTEGGHLELLAVFNDDHHAEFATDGDRSLENRLDLLREGGGDDVVVARFATQQNVAHAATHPERREAGPAVAICS